MRRLLIALVIGVLGSAGFALADPNLSDIPRHRHFIQTPSGGLVEVGPRFCDDPALQDAFNQFHNNVHMVSPTGIGPAAPGLHNFKGADIVMGLC
jgi:hypothetical protein